MRKTWKKATAITLAGVTAMSMAACGGSSDKKESTSSTTEDGKPVISMMVPAFYGTELQNEHSDEVIKKYEDYTGVSVEWKFENDGTYKEKLGLTLMDKDNMPMILTSNVELSANIVDAAKKGAFWDLTSISGRFRSISESLPGRSGSFKSTYSGRSDHRIISCACQRSFRSFLQKRLGRESWNHRRSEDN